MVNNKRASLISWAFIILLVQMIASATDVIPPEDLTQNRMPGVINRVLEFAVDHHRLPEKLTDLPTREDYDDSTVDGWDNPLIYERHEDGTFSLSSNGTDEATDRRTFRFSLVDVRQNDEFIAVFDTCLHMQDLMTLIRAYVLKHHCLPEALENVKGVIWHIPYTPIDGWRNTILYRPQPDGSVLLISKVEKDPKLHFSLQFRVSGLATPATTQATDAVESKAKDAAQ